MRSESIPTTVLPTMQTVLANPDSPDRQALISVLADGRAATVVACLAPTGTFAQTAAALSAELPWLAAGGWERHGERLVDCMTDPRWSCTTTVSTWSDLPGAVGVLRDRTPDLIIWARHRLDRWKYGDLATLLGPSDEAARLLIQSFSSTVIGRTLRRWSMGIDPGTPTAWQAMIDPDLRAVLRENADVSRAFPAWGWDDAVTPQPVLFSIVNDLIDGWSSEHPSIRGRIGWLAHHVTPDLRIDRLALVASIGRSDALAEAVGSRIEHNPGDIALIAPFVPWDRLHPQIQTVIDETRRQASDPTWACAIGQERINLATIRYPTILLWRIGRARWDALDPALRDALVQGIPSLPDHCYGWGVHPDVVAGTYHLYGGRIFRFWNPAVPPDDLRAWAYADLFLDQRDRHAPQVLTALLAELSPERRARFEQIIKWRLGGRPVPTDQSPRIHRRIR